MPSGSGASGGLTRFNVEGIHDMAAQTTRTGNRWDEIWQETLASLRVVSQGGVDAATGGALEQRNTQYNQRSEQYRQQIMLQATTNTNVGDHASGVNTRMVGTIGGGAV